MKRSLIYLIALSWSASIGVVATSQPIPVAPAGTVSRGVETPHVPGPVPTVKASTVAPVKDVEQAELIVKEPVVPAGSFAEVSIKGVAAGDIVNYKVRPKPTKQVVSNGVLYFNGLAQSYEVEATVINWDTRKWQVADAVVAFGSQPQPPPGPGPTPIPVTPTKFKIVIIEETEEAVAGRGAFLASATLKSYFDAKGHSWRVVDKDVTDVNGKQPADLVPYFQLAAGKKLPQVFLIDEAGKLRFQGDCSMKAADLIALLKQWGG